MRQAPVVAAVGAAAGSVAGAAGNAANHGGVGALGYGGTVIDPEGGGAARVGESDFPVIAGGVEDYVVICRQLAGVSERARAVARALPVGQAY